MSILTEYAPLNKELRKAIVLSCKLKNQGDVDIMLTAELCGNLEHKIKIQLL